MSDRNCMELLKERMGEGKTVCVGLDSAIGRLPAEALRKRTPHEAQLFFNKQIIDATADLAVAMKGNLAIYRGAKGKTVLRKTVRYLRKVAPGVPFILDAKQGDIGNSNDGYVAEDFEWFGADAVTVHPFMGLEGMRPFMDQADKGIIVLCRTSNPGAEVYQRRMVRPKAAEVRAWGLPTYSGLPFYQLVAHDVVHNWNYNGNCMMVVGATVAEDELQAVRTIAGEMPLLIPGIGAQAGDLAATVRYGADSAGQGMVINNSRQLIFAYEKDPVYQEGMINFAVASRKVAQTMHSDVQALLAP